METTYSLKIFWIYEHPGTLGTGQWAVDWATIFFLCIYWKPFFNLWTSGIKKTSTLPISQVPFSSPGNYSLSKVTSDVIHEYRNCWIFYWKDIPSNPSCIWPERPLNVRDKFKTKKSSNMQQRNAFIQICIRWWTWWDLPERWVIFFKVRWSTSYRVY